MSASFVRQKTEEWCGDISQLLGIPFYKTVNIEVNPSDPVWFTVDYISLFHEGLLCKRGYLERGIVRVVFAGEPGKGWEDTINAVEQVVPLLSDKLDPTRRFSWDSYEPIVEETDGSVNSGYMVSVAFNYLFQL